MPALRRKLFPRALREAFDARIAPLLAGSNDLYLFGPMSPHERLLEQFDAVMPFLFRGERGRNFVEVGVGAGGASYTARRLGFDVCATDSVGGGCADAGAESRRFLGIEPVQFTYTPERSFGDVVAFEDGRLADVIFCQSVPFNRFLDAEGAPLTREGKNWVEKSHWYGASEWLRVVEDVAAHLEPGGRFVDLRAKGVSREMAAEVIEATTRRFGERISVTFDQVNVPLITDGSEVVSSDVTIRRHA